MSSWHTVSANLAWRCLTTERQSVRVCMGLASTESGVAHLLTILHKVGLSVQKKCAIIPDAYSPGVEKRDYAESWTWTDLADGCVVSD